MKVARLTDVQKVAIEHSSIPEVEPGGALIKVETCGICGSDVHSYSTGNLFPVGTVMGHEATGTVVEVGLEVQTFAPGQRVVVYGSTPCGSCSACRRGLDYYCLEGMERTVGNSPELDGAFAEYLWLPQADQTLLPLPDSISFDEGALTDPIATALHAIRLSRFRPGDMVAVLGAGPIGLMAVQLLRLGGAARIVATDISPHRLEVAGATGADLVLNPADEDETLVETVTALTDGLGMDVIYECSGAPAAFRQSLDLVRPGGQVVSVGVGERDVQISLLAMVGHELCLQGSLWASRHEFELALGFLARDELQVERLISDRIPLEEIDERGFRRLLAGMDGIKILVKPRGNGQP